MPPRPPPCPRSLVLRYIAESVADNSNMFAQAVEKHYMQQMLGQIYKVVFGLQVRASIEPVGMDGWVDGGMLNVERGCAKQ